MDDIALIIAAAVPVIAFYSIFNRIESRLSTMETKVNWLVKWVACLNEASDRPLSDGDLAKVALTKDELKNCSEGCNPEQFIKK